MYTRLTWSSFEPMRAKIPHSCLDVPLLQSVLDHGRDHVVRGSGFEYILSLRRGLIYLLMLPRAVRRGLRGPPPPEGGEGGNDTGMLFVVDKNSI